MKGNTTVVRRSGMASFRDPSGSLFRIDNRIIRMVRLSCWENFVSFLGSNAASTFIESGRMVKTRFLDISQTEILRTDCGASEYLRIQDSVKLVEHEPVLFQSFPYEWAPEMLHAAAHLTIDLAEAVLLEGFGLKDATPHNVVFEGPRPVFVDVASVERRDPRDSIWLAQAQFVRSFLLPLLINRHLGIPLGSLLLTHPDGINPEEAYLMCGCLRRMLPSFLTLATIPTWLARALGHPKTGVYRPRLVRDPHQALFVLRLQCRRLRQILHGLSPKSRKSSWSGYPDHEHVSPEYLMGKIGFLKDSMGEYKPESLLDIGCNTGDFSILAAQMGARVLAIDSDPCVIGLLWRRALKEYRSVLPLVVDIAHPTPGTGWMNQECASFLERTRGQFKMVLMLAVIHHLLVTDRIPLSHIIDLAADLTADLLMIEYVAPQDPMFQRIARGRDRLFEDINQVVFEATCRRRFEILRIHQTTHATRRLYLLRKTVTPVAH